jgi:SNF2 family DNA or RNA helicase
MVHKMVCEDTLEERIDQIIQGKSELVDQVVGEGETWIGNLNDDQLVELLSFGSRR